MTITASWECFDVVRGKWGPVPPHWVGDDHSEHKAFDLRVPEAERDGLCRIDNGLALAVGDEVHIADNPLAIGSYRGYVGGRCVIWTGRTQITVSPASIGAKFYSKE